MTRAVYRRSDKQQPGGARPDFTRLLGQWRNLDDATQGLLQLTLCSDGELHTLHVLGADRDETADWGQVGASFYVAEGTTQALGFHAKFTRNGLNTYIAANLNKGIYVVQTYTSGVNNGPGIFSKEYFRRCASSAGDND